ncbi:endothelin-converting enzyme 2-like protein 2 [Sarcoptes scabiei]|uniref:Endothelin-converting enzyme 2-like protein 2 n=1 Tax=Sarcoptes scabiei TaxID=52283 RepID=A0A132AAX1_SARSC|nr:endothelin-converting enzyme 2-like protein 2 [Sarcoptes scabiei]
MPKLKPWKGGDVARKPGGGQKIILLREFLETIRDQNDLVILFTDSYDVIINGDRKDILKKFHSFDARIVFSAEKYCWPDSSLASKYPKSNGKRYLNSGGFIGYANDLYELVNADRIRNDDDDQLYYTRLYLDPKYRDQLRIKLDTNSLLFQNLNGEIQDVELRFTQAQTIDRKNADAFLFNKAFQSDPIIVHGNGASKIPLNSLGNYLAKSWHPAIGCISCDESTFSLESIDFLYCSFKKRGIWNVPFISTAYLIKSTLLKGSDHQPLSYRSTRSETEENDEAIDPDMFFCHKLRSSGHFMFVTNVEDFGHLAQMDTLDVSLKHPEFYEIYTNEIEWRKRYIHPNYSQNFLEVNLIEQPCPDVYWFPVVTPIFCRHLIASSIINSLDETKNACDDFYQYACGGWINKNPLPDGYAVWGTFGKLTQDNQLILKSLLENRNYSFSDAERKAKNYYDSCMDKKKIIEKLKAKPMQDFIDLIGGWNISGGFDVHAWNLQSKITLMHNKYNRGGLFEWSVSADEKDPAKNILDLQQSSFVMPRDYYLNKTDDDEIMVAYLDFMTKIGVLLGGDETITRNQMKDVIAFERKIAEITVPQRDLRDDQKTYHKMLLKDLNKLSPFLNWVQYFKEAFIPINRDINENESIVVYSPEYFGNLSKLILEHQDDYNKTVIANTIIWSIVQPLVSYLSKPFKDAAKSFTQVLIGSEGSTSQWRFCISDTSNVLGFALGSMFVRSAFRGESKNESKVMIQQIKDAFKNHLIKLSWMDSKTIELAMEKADAITDMIGFPDFILNEEKLNKRYKDVRNAKILPEIEKFIFDYFTSVFSSNYKLTIKEDQYFQNSIQSNIFMLNEHIKKIDKPTNKSEWDMPPPMVNAYYAPTKNQIAFPAGILQPPFYDVARPKALNFGAMGVVMGHELTHAFDDQGREYDKKGRLQEWWQHGTILKFKEKMKCFQEQYSKYEIENDHIDGKQTLGENVADNGGLTSAFNVLMIELIC